MLNTARCFLQSGRGKDVARSDVVIARAVGTDEIAFRALAGQGGIFGTHVCEL